MPESSTPEQKTLLQLLGRAWGALGDDSKRALSWFATNSGSPEPEMWLFAAAVQACSVGGQTGIFTGCHQVVCPSEFDILAINAAGSWRDPVLRELEEFLNDEGHLRVAIDQALEEAGLQECSRAQSLIAVCPVALDLLMSRALRPFAASFRDIAYSFVPKVVIPYQGFGVRP